MGQSSQPHELGGGLKSRHVTMLSIAGVIGASLFVGSSVAIAEAGPAVLLAYLFAGLLVVMIMRLLAEMAVATPDTGSFSTYADKAIGRWAGYTIGWLYWWFWVLVIPLEANIAAMILHSWVPGIPIWLFSLVITLALTGSNLLSVKNYGSSPYPTSTGNRYPLQSRLRKVFFSFHSSFVISYSVGSTTVILLCSAIDAVNSIAAFTPPPPTLTLTCASN